MSGEHITVICLGCVSEKRPGTHAASELYDSQLFRARLKYAKERTDMRHIRILSAKHYAIDPSDRIDCYDQKLPTKRDHLEGWGEQTAGLLIREYLEMYPQCDSITYEIHAGRAYAESLMRIDFWHDRPSAKNLKTKLTTTWPVEGMGIGQQLQWYSRQTIHMELWQ
jgi:hypothetical protein